MSDATPVDPSNLDQLRAWDGDDGEFWAARSERFHEGVARYHDRLLTAAAIDSNANVLDIGCGTGKTTRDAARQASAGSALGVDLSSRMIEIARRTAAREDLPNTTFLQADAQVHPFPQRHFDVGLSRNGAMFFGDAPAAFRNIARAMRPGGRLVLLAWQPFECNEWLSTFRAVFSGGRDLPPPPQEGPGPFSLSDPDRVRKLLTSAGFADVRFTGLDEPMYFGRDVDDACEFVTGQFAKAINQLGEDSRASALDGLRASLAEHQTARGVRYNSAAWLIEARLDER
ncbi:MAG TPA: class I SAM-dependent methyltransferase [Amycolatopsis sp.]|nr:class I SAM-dependent methyltransferase [Amycolatopsis sp.]